MSLAFVVPGSLGARTGGSTYNRFMVRGLREQGRHVVVIEAEGAFPHPDVHATTWLDGALANLAEGATVVVDGLIFGCVPELAERHGRRLRLVSLIHLPLAEAPGLDAATSAALRDAERRALRSAHHIIITGQATRSLLDGLEVPQDRLALVEPGTDGPSAEELLAARAGRARRRGQGPVRLLSVATLNPGKGHQALLRALTATTGASWHLTCAGSHDHHPPTVAAVRALVAERGLASRVRLAGHLDDAGLRAAYRDADAFVLATRRETYSMAVASALAWGLPVISTRTGAIPDMVGDAAGLVVPVDDEAALTAALERVLGDADLRDTFAGGATAAAARLPRWPDQVARFADVVDAIA